MFEKDLCLAVSTGITDRYGNILLYEITKFPGSLADKKDGSIRSGNKAELQCVLKQSLDIFTWPNQLPSTECNTGLVYDAMALAHALGKEKAETCRQLSHRYFRKVMGDLRVVRNVTIIHWVGDSYDQKLSPKYTVVSTVKC